MLWDAFVALVVVWTVFLAIAIVYLASTASGSLTHWGRVLRRRVVAERRAHALMREVLNPEQLQQLSRHGYVEVPSPSIPHRVYRVPGAGGLVRVYEQGHAIMDLCLQPLEPLPDGDVIVMHKLMIEGNEHEYLAKANHFAPGIISLRCGYF
ncbi:MAG TPA: hypothetical protein VFU88_21840 [Ktedonobacterales bacterium]|jgi:hypothetical protein|nr:hypothetical protein [Ktedonobacterales bacterium]